MKTRITKQTIKLALCALALAGLALTTQGQMYQWTFDGGSGTTVTPSVATGGGGGLTLGGTAAYGAAGSGVSGAAGDLALRTTIRPMARVREPGGLQHDGDINLGTLTAFTMTGWMKADGGFTTITRRPF